MRKKDVPPTLGLRVVLTSRYRCRAQKTIFKARLVPAIKGHFSKGLILFAVTLIRTFHVRSFIFASIE